MIPGLVQSAVVMGGILAGTAFPQSFGQSAPKATFTAAIVPATVRRGETVKLQVRARIDPGWHIYAPTSNPEGGLPTAVTVEKNDVFTPVGKLTGPEPEKHLDEGFGFEIEYYSGEVELTLPIRVKPSAPLGGVKVPVKIDYMACSDVTCTPPARADATATATVAEGPPRMEYSGAKQAGTQPDRETGIERPAPDTPASPATSPVGNTPQNLRQAVQKGFWSFAWLAISMGFLALLTPCVFPMIPITVSFFTGHEGRTRRQTVGMAATYALGIVATYTLVGLILAATLGAAGANRLASSPYFNLFVSVLFVAFALSMFGLFEFRLPSSLVQVTSREQGRSGIPGVLFMSLTFALVSFSCTVQFVGLLLVAAAHGQWLWPAAGMALFSSALALPFFFLALFPRFLESLPRSGEWMEAVKIVMGFVLVALATKFLSNVDALWGWGVLNRTLVLAVWVCSLGLAGAYLVGKLPLPGAAGGVGALRLMLAMAFLTTSLYLGSGLVGRPLSGWISAFLPPDESVATAGSSAAGLTWLSSYNAGLTEAKRVQKPVFLDFSGHTCTNCRWMEANIFPRPEVVSLLQEYVRVRLLTDMGAQAAANRGLQVERFGTTALPFYVLLTPTGREIARFPGLTKDPRAFAAFLRSGLDAGRPSPQPAGA